MIAKAQVIWCPWSYLFQTAVILPASPLAIPEYMLPKQSPARFLSYSLADTWKHIFWSLTPFKSYRAISCLSYTRGCRRSHSLIYLLWSKCTCTNTCMERRALLTVLIRRLVLASLPYVTAMAAHLPKTSHKPQNNVLGIGFLQATIHLSLYLQHPSTPHIRWPFCNIIRMETSKQN